MPLTREEIESQFSNKFHFEKINGTGRNPHERWAFFYKDKKVATTGFSRSCKNKESIDDDLLLLMAREIRVQTLHNFKGMITCTISLDDYIKILKDQNFIPNKKVDD